MLEMAAHCEPRLAQAKGPEGARPALTERPAEREATSRTRGYEPTRQECRYSSCSGVSASIPIPAAASLSRATSVSISSGTS